MKPFDAALRGSREIVFAVIGMTITLAAVFAPIAFSGGITGRLFTEFALLLLVQLSYQALLALTLTPVMCARTLECKHGHIQNFINVRSVILKN